MTEIKLLPLPEVLPFSAEGAKAALQEWSRACIAKATAAQAAEIEALRAEVERLQAIVKPKREEECLTLDHWRMRAYDLEANWSRCSRACAVESTKRQQAEARAERLAEALQRLNSATRRYMEERQESDAEWASDEPSVLSIVDAALEQEEGNGQ